jgi:hypothetical protein
LLSFQASLKQKEMTEDIRTEAPTDDCPEGTINLMVVKIASENLTVFEDLDATRTTLKHGSQNRSKQLDFRGLQQNQSGSDLKTEQFSVNTEHITVAKRFSVGFTSLLINFSRF